DDQIVYPRAVLDSHQMPALGPGDSQLRACRHGVGEEALSERRVDPRPRHQAGAVARSNFALVGVDDRVQSGRVNQPPFDQELLERLNPRGGTVFGSVMRVFTHRSRLFLRWCASETPVFLTRFFLRLRLPVAERARAFFARSFRPAAAESRFRWT